MKKSQINPLYYLQKDVRECLETIFLIYSKGIEIHHFVTANNKMKIMNSLAKYQTKLRKLKKLWYVVLLLLQKNI